MSNLLTDRSIYFGAHLLNSTAGTDVQILYWRERNHEVDFVLRRGDRLVAIEVKSGRRKGALPGMAAFDKAFHPDIRLLVGADGVGLDEFMSRPAGEWTR